VGNGVQAVVAFDAVGTLAVVNAEAEHAVVAGAFEAVLDQLLVALGDLGGRVVEEQTQVAARRARRS
jgi:hypothetical protein